MQGMEYLHSKKIVHFDLKSANLLLGHRDRRTICKVADFGLSKQKMDTYVSGVSSQRGTLSWYWSLLEQRTAVAIPADVLTHRVRLQVDVYSFGIVLWELWTGREPYEGLNYHALLHQITTACNVRPPLPGSSDWEHFGGDTCPAEPAEGYATLVQVSRLCECAATHRLIVSGSLHWPRGPPTVSAARALTVQALEGSRQADVGVRCAAVVLGREAPEPAQLHRHRELPEAHGQRAAAAAASLSAGGGRASQGRACCPAALRAGPAACQRTPLPPCACSRGGAPAWAPLAGLDVRASS